MLVTVHVHCPGIRRCVQKFKEKKLFDETEIVSDLSPQLKTQIFLHNKRDLLHKTPLFSVM